MKELSFNEVKPFVRYSRKFDCYGDDDAIRNAYDYRLFYCTDGKGAIQVDNIEYEMSSGTLLMFSPGIEYKILAGKCEAARFYILNFDYTFAFSDLTVPIPPGCRTSFDENKIVEKVIFTDADILNNVVYLKEMYTIKNLLISLNDKFEQKMNFSYLRCSGILIDVLVEIYEKAMLSLNKKTKHTVIPEVVEFIGNNFETNLSNRSIGEKFGYHPNYLNQLFMQHTGTTIHKYILNMRINKAIHLLQDTMLPLGEISSNLGFGDYSYFSKSFKTITGLSPKNFRK